MKNTKIKTLEQIKFIAARLRAEGQHVVTTNGSFDILHPAHIRLFEKAKSCGDVLIVLLNSDSSIKANKGDKRPIVPESDRAYVLASLAPIDYVVVFNEDKPVEILKQLKPHFHVKGGSWIPERIQEEKELLESWGGEFKNFELEEGYSSTNIIDRILDAYRD